MVEKIIKFKNWILGLGIVGVIIWWTIKIIICLTCGICLL